MTELEFFKTAIKIKNEEYEVVVALAIIAKHMKENNNKIPSKINDTINPLFDYMKDNKKEIESYYLKNNIDAKYIVSIYPALLSKSISPKIKKGIIDLYQHLEEYEYLIEIINGKKNKNYVFAKNNYNEILVFAEENYEPAKIILSKLETLNFYSPEYEKEEINYQFDYNLKRLEKILRTRKISFLEKSVSKDKFLYKFIEENKFKIIDLEKTNKSAAYIIKNLEYFKQVKLEVKLSKIYNLLKEKDYLDKILKKELTLTIEEVETIKKMKSIEAETIKNKLSFLFNRKSSGLFNTTIKRIYSFILCNYQLNNNDVLFLNSNKEKIILLSNQDDEEINLIIEKSFVFKEYKINLKMKELINKIEKQKNSPIEVTLNKQTKEKVLNLYLNKNEYAIKIVDLLLPQFIIYDNLELEKKYFCILDKLRESNYSGISDTTVATVYLSLKEGIISTAKIAINKEIKDQSQLEQLSMQLMKYNPLKSELIEMLKEEEYNFNKKIVKK